MRSVPLLHLPPRGEQPAIWIGPRISIVGWGEAWRTRVVGPDAIREAAATWREEVRSARIQGGIDQAPDAFDRVALPLAFGSFGFADHTEGSLVVPAVHILDTSSGRYVVSSEPIDLDTLGAGAETPAAPVRPRVVSPDLATEWTGAVAAVVDRLRSGEASKAVMARSITVSSDQPLDVRNVAQSLHELYPTTWTYAVDGLVGATPEMLASTLGNTVVSRVLAGTAAPDRGEDLLASAKDMEEHRLAAQSVVDALASVAIDVEPQGPFVLTLPNVTHLATDVHASLEGTSVLDVVAALHPTAAVCGTPREAARSLIERYEAGSRGRYAGPVGYVDAEGQGEFGIALRCGQVHGSNIDLWAGAGIMPQSDPATEYAETDAKLRPMVEALGVTAR